MQLCNYKFEFTSNFLTVTTKFVNVFIHEHEVDASLTANIRAPPGRGPPCFRICGQIFHRVATLHPDQGVAPAFNHFYIFESQQALQQRLDRHENVGCREDVMLQIQNVINDISPFALAYKHMLQVETEENEQAAQEGRPVSQVTMHMHTGADRRRYNLPNHEEVAAVFVGQDGAPPAPKDVVIYPRIGLCEPFQLYHVIWTQCAIRYSFPRGDAGWHRQIAHVASKSYTCL